MTVGAQLVLNVMMQPGNPEQVVRTAAATASRASSASGSNVSSSTVRETPLNGRDWTQLATLQAGVTGVQTGSATGGGNTNRGFGAAMSISGARPDQNSYRLGWDQHQRLFERGPRQRPRRQPGSGRCRAVFCSGKQLSGPTWTNFGRSDQRGDAFGHQCFSRQCLRIPPEQLARCAKLV